MTAKQIERTIMRNVDSSTPEGAAQLAREVDNTERRFERARDFAPFGGWRNRAIEHVANRHGMNPHALDRIIRSVPFTD